MLSRTIMYGQVVRKHFTPKPTALSILCGHRTLMPHIVMELILCLKCGLEKPAVKFPKSKNKDRSLSKNKDGTIRRGSPCFRCREKARLNNPNSVIGETVLRRRRRYLANPENVPSIIIRTAKHSDKEHSRPGFDLDRNFVADLIKNGCLYCGAVDLRMTLDRIDNQLGHTKSNINPSCVRCNHIRGSMPYEAWMNLVPSVRKTYELGLFQDWWTDTKSIYRPSSYSQATSVTADSPMNVIT